MTNIPVASLRFCGTARVHKTRISLRRYWSDIFPLRGLLIDSFYNDAHDDAEFFQRGLRFGLKEQPSTTLRPPLLKSKPAACGKTRVLNPTPAKRSLSSLGTFVRIAGVAGPKVKVMVFRRRWEVSRCAGK